MRTDAQALFVLDTSRSMAASSTRTSPTRLDRAVGAAVRLRSAIPGVAAGVATLTDRVLPDLLPVADVGAFDRVATRAVGIERPPPRDSSVRATALGALSEIASGDYFDQAAKRRIVVLLTDGESNPVNAGELARSLPAAKGYRLVAVRFWNGGESVFGTDGKPEPGYRPDPAGRAILAGLASATGGKAFEEGSVGSASSYVKDLVGGGPTRMVGVGQPSTTPLAPYVAALALVFLVSVFWPVQTRAARLRLSRQ